MISLEAYSDLLATLHAAPLTTNTGSSSWASYAPSLEEVSMLRKTSPATTRSQMKGLFDKTSTHRQGELIQLLSSLPRPSTATQSSR